MEKGEVKIPAGIGFILGRLLNRQFYEPAIQSTFKQRHEILSYMFKKNMIQLIDLDLNPLKRYLSKPEIQNVESKQDFLSNLKIKKKNKEGEIEKLKYQQTKNKCMFLNQLSFEISHSRYVSMAYGVLIASIINMTLLRNQHGVRKGFALIFLTHLMGQTTAFKREKMAYDFVYPIYQKYDKQDIDLMIENKK